MLLTFAFFDEIFLFHKKKASGKFPVMKLKL